VAPEEVLEVLLVENVSLGLILELRLPVESDRAGCMCVFVCFRVDVDLDQSKVGAVVLEVVEALLDPISRDEYVFGVVVCHTRSMDGDTQRDYLTGQFGHQSTLPETIAATGIGEPHHRSYSGCIRRIRGVYWSERAGQDRNSTENKQVLPLSR